MIDLSVHDNTIRDSMNSNFEKISDCIVPIQFHVGDTGVCMFIGGSFQFSEYHGGGTTAALSDICHIANENFAVHLNCNVEQASMYYLSGGTDKLQLSGRKEVIYTITSQLSADSSQALSSDECTSSKQSKSDEFLEDAHSNVEVGEDGADRLVWIVYQVQTGVSRDCAVLSSDTLLLKSFISTLIAGRFHVQILVLDAFQALVRSATVGQIGLCDSVAALELTLGVSPGTVKLAQCDLNSSSGFACHVQHLLHSSTEPATATVTVVSWNAHFSHHNKHVHRDTFSPANHRQSASLSSSQYPTGLSFLQEISQLPTLAKRVLLVLVCLSGKTSVGPFGFPVDAILTYDHSVTLTRKFENLNIPVLDLSDWLAPITSLGSLKIIDAHDDIRDKMTVATVVHVETPAQARAMTGHIQFLGFIGQLIYDDPIGLYSFVMATLHESHDIVLALTVKMGFLPVAGGAGTRLKFGKYDLELVRYSGEVAVVQQVLARADVLVDFSGEGEQDLVLDMMAHLQAVAVVTQPTRQSVCSAGSWLRHVQCDSGELVCDVMACVREVTVEAVAESTTLSMSLLEWYSATVRRILAALLPIRQRAAGTCAGMSCDSAARELRSRMLLIALAKKLRSSLLWLMSSPQDRQACGEFSHVIAHCENLEQVIAAELSWFERVATDKSFALGLESSHAGIVDLSQFHKQWCKGLLPDQLLEGFSLDHANMQVVNMLARHKHTTQEPPSVRVLCVTYTISPRHSQVRAIVDSWGKQCSGYMAASNLTDLSINALSVSRQGLEVFDNIWQKVKGIWTTVAGHLLQDQYDWVFISGDDTYLLVDNLMAYLSSPEILSASSSGATPLFLGQTWRWNDGLSYNHGGGGYVLNAAAVRVLQAVLRSGSCATRASVSMEDVMVASCLSAAGVTVHDTRDALMRPRFHHASPGARYSRSQSTIEGYTFGLDSRHLAGDNCCARDSISFHFIKDALSMRLLHHLLHPNTSDAKRSV